MLNKTLLILCCLIAVSSSAYCGEVCIDSMKLKKPDDLVATDYCLITVVRPEHKEVKDLLKIPNKSVKPIQPNKETHDGQ